MKADGGSCHGYAGNGDKTRMSFERYLLSDLSVYPRVTGFTVVTPVARSPLKTNLPLNMPVTDASASVKQADAVEPVMKKPRTAQTAAQTLFTMWAKPMADAVEPVMKKPRTAQTAAQTLFTMWAKPMGA